MNRKDRSNFEYWKNVAEAGIRFGVNSRRHQDVNGEFLSHRRIVNYRQSVLEHPRQNVVQDYQASDAALTPKLSFPSMRDATFIEDAYELFEVLPDLRDSDVIAIDCQSSSKLSYGDMICTIQLSTINHDYIIDAINLPFEVRRDLKPILECPNKLFVMHNGTQNIRWLKHQFQIFPTGVFDIALFHQVMTGGTLVSFGEIKEAYLNELEIPLETQRKKLIAVSDWTLRPIPKEMLSYAQETHNLLRVFNSILIKGYAEEVKISMASMKDELLRPCDAFITSTPEKDLQKLCRWVGLYDDRSKATYKNLWNYRDLLARYFDRNPYDVLFTRTLVNIARKQTADVIELHSVIYGDLLIPRKQFFPRQSFRIVSSIVAEGDIILQKIKATVCHGCCEKGHPGWACWKEYIVWSDKKEFFFKPENMRFKSSENRRHDRRKSRKAEFIARGLHSDPNEDWDTSSAQMEHVPPTKEELINIVDELQSESGSDSTLQDWYSAESIISDIASSFGYETAYEF